MTKTEKAISFYKAGLLKDSLQIFCKFSYGFTQEEKRCLQIASESLNGHDSFYRSLGIDVEHCIESAKALLSKKYSF